MLDSRRGETLLRTALAYLDVNGATAEAASRLAIHPNTVRQRLEQIDSLMGAGWREGSRRLDIHVALRLWQLTTGAY